MDVIDTYILKKPNLQNILDLFKGEWSSSLPKRYNLNTGPNTIPLFEDVRVDWAEKTLGSFTGQNILELGPLEGGHSFMFQERQAKNVVAIEANTRAFLKCLCIKEVLNLDKVSFRLGDFMAYLKDHKESYDLVFACGVLYHMKSPIVLLERISKVTTKVFLWTHYYDADKILSNPTLKHKFNTMESFEYEGITYQGAMQSYQDAHEWQGFCSEPLHFSKWLTRDSIFRALRHVGFREFHIHFDEPDHPNGPAFAICATKH